ncbi:MAG: deaminase [Gemmatimonadetes bacterium]|nr:deaminase [Gemmatimonadota bacterium]
MRRIVMFNRVSADGCFSAADGGLDWVVPEPALDREAARSLGDADAILFGRRTYEMFESFWPRALDGDSPDAEDPHAPGRRSPELHAMAKWIDDVEKVVFSRTRKEVAWSNSRLLHGIDPAEIEAMKAGPGKDMMIFGSGSVVSELTRHGLIDEYQLVVSPVLLGSGRTLLTEPPAGRELVLAEAKSYPSGNVMLRYLRPE